MRVPRAAADDHLRRRIVRRATVRVSPIPCWVSELLGKPEVDELDVAVFVEEDILGLQVSVDDAALMKLL